ncbi:hypothetical protein ERJ75_001759200 [Trypanosoma vivax]|nr:hypothetical protein ERJ75_001759000 [Trypanosoma vivax]KAH8603993.1 hypothetical protein ERJ75_001759200 [Trypanosoma vivax]
MQQGTGWIASRICRRRALWRRFWWGLAYVIRLAGRASLLSLVAGGEALKEVRAPELNGKTKQPRAGLSKRLQIAAAACCARPMDLRKATVPGRNPGGKELRILFSVCPGRGLLRYRLMVV